MIQVKELTKIYKSHRGGTCVALDHISFTLPDKGFVFVIGKSGSGKTTLLSLLGGLDTITSGEIITNGRHLEQFKLKEQIAYRNATVGFIFQDFYLLDDLTISENIMLALNLQGRDDEKRVRKVLAAIGLAGCENRYPKELSGGQKQRVAIARALIKQPSVVLADEPTGNLDSKTAVQILGLLQALSKQKLVVIVSHDLANAQKYADEIIELSDGKIVRHMKRNESFDRRLRVEQDTLVIPYGEEFSDENLSEVTEAMRSGAVRRVRQDKERFEPYTGTPVTRGRSAPAPQRHLRPKDRAALSLKFARHSWIRMAVYALILAAIMVILGLSQLIMNFNGSEVVASEMEKRGLGCTSFIKDINEAYESVDTSRLVNVGEDDLQAFLDAGYTGKAYPLVNYAIYSSSNDISIRHLRPSIHTDPYDIPSTFGVLLTEESFLKAHFGELEYLALSPSPQPYGVYITDFFADACISAHPESVSSYQKLLGRATPAAKHAFGYINGIIKTGYKEKYGELFRKLADPLSPRNEVLELVQSDEGMAFYDDLCQYLAVAYSFEPDFVENSVQAGVRQLVSSGHSVFRYQGRSYPYQGTHFSDSEVENSAELGENEILMKYDVYNETFGTNYSPQNMKDFVPHEVTFTYFLPCDEGMSQKKYEGTLRIVGLTNKTAQCNMADNVFQALQRIENFTYGYYFENNGQTQLLVDTAEENGYLPFSSIGSMVTTMTKAVNIFSDFFRPVFFILCAALLLLVIQFEVKNIKDRMKDIGIMKALGARDIDLILIFGLQIAVIGLLMAALYIVGSFLLIGFANDVLLLSLSRLSKRIIMSVSLLSVKWTYLVQNCLLALLIIVVSFIVPMLRLRVIKPTNIIKEKE